MGRKKHNMCSKCGFRHAAPTGKACSAGVGEQVDELLSEDKNVQGGQAPNLVGLDGLCDSQNRRKAVSSEDRIDRLERDMSAMGGKLDLILENMKKPTVQVSEDEDVVEGWSREIAEAWEEVKPRGRPTRKPAKPVKPTKPRVRSTSSSSSATETSEGETKQYERKRFAQKDHKFKRATEIVNVCVKTLEKVINEGGDPIPALKHLKFVSDKVSKGCFNFEAISGYDEAVRARVALEGYSGFAKIETDEVFVHFSVENTIKRLESTNKPQASKYKPNSGAKANGI